MANCCVVFSAILVSLAAILVGLYYNQFIPEEFPDDQRLSARVSGAVLDLFSFMVSWSAKALLSPLGAINLISGPKRWGLIKAGSLIERRGGGGGFI